MTTIKRTTESRSRRKKSFRARCNRPLEPETYSGSCRNTEQTFFRIVRNKGAGAGAALQSYFLRQVAPAPRSPYSHAYEFVQGSKTCHQAQRGMSIYQLNGCREDFRRVLLDYVKAIRSSLRARLRCGSSNSMLDRLHPNPQPTKSRRLVAG